MTAEGASIAHGPGDQVDMATLSGRAEHAAPQLAVATLTCVRHPAPLAHELEHLEVAVLRGRFARPVICDTAILAQVAQRGPLLRLDGGGHRFSVPRAARCTEFLQHGHIATGCCCGDNRGTPTPVVHRSQV